MPKHKTKLEGADIKRRRQIRQDLAKSIEGALIINELDEACHCVSAPDRNYLSALVDDLLRQLREA